MDAIPHEEPVAASSRTSVTRAGIERRPVDALLLLVGTGVLLLTAVPIHQHSVSDLEASLFRLVNHLPDIPFAIVWLPMQLGNLVIVPLAVVAALVARRWRLSIELALAGAGVYVLAKVVKHYVLRGRPDSVLDDVIVRGAAPHGLGYVSGHIGVITALAFVAAPWVPPRWRWVLLAAVAAVFFARMYVGAHLPLDMIGGAALGLAVGAGVRLLLGIPARTRPAEGA